MNLVRQAYFIVAIETFCIDLRNDEESRVQVTYLSFLSSQGERGLDGLPGHPGEEGDYVSTGSFSFSSFLFPSPTG